MTQKQLHYFDPDSFVHIDTVEAKRDPFDECWLVPSNATLAPLATAKEGEENHINVFDPVAELWTLKSDFRGLIYYSKENGEAVEIKDVGEVPATLTAKARPNQWHHFDQKKDKWVLDEITYLADLKRTTKEKINQIRNLFEESVFIFNGVPIDCDSTSRQRLADACISAQIAMTIGLEIPDIVWTCADNTQMNLTVKELLSMQAAFTIHMNTCHAWATDLKNQVDLAKTEAEINATLEGLVYE